MFLYSVFCESTTHLENKGRTQNNGLKSTGSETNEKNTWSEEENE